ncbi:hypothetical protein V1478_008673, partial [Vespula squamosa]
DRTRTLKRTCPVTYYSSEDRETTRRSVHSKLRLPCRNKQTNIVRATGCFNNLKTLQVDREKQDSSGNSDTRSTQHPTSRQAMANQEEKPPISPWIATTCYGPRRSRIKSLDLPPDIQPSDVTDMRNHRCTPHKYPFATTNSIVEPMAVKRPTNRARELRDPRVQDESSRYYPRILSNWHKYPFLTEGNRVRKSLHGPSSTKFDLFASVPDYRLNGRLRSKLIQTPCRPPCKGIVSVASAQGRNFLSDKLGETSLVEQSSSKLDYLAFSIIEGNPRNRAAAACNTPTLHSQLRDSVAFTKFRKAGGRQNEGGNQPESRQRRGKVLHGIGSTIKKFEICGFLAQ